MFRKISYETSLCMCNISALHNGVTGHLRGYLNDLVLYSELLLCCCMQSQAETRALLLQ